MIKAIMNWFGFNDLEIMGETVSPTKWKNIEVGEVFAISGCVFIGYKQSEHKVKWLSSDIIWAPKIGTETIVPNLDVDGLITFHNFYKLPSKIQELFLVK